MSKDFVKVEKDETVLTFNEIESTFPDLVSNYSLSFDPAKALPVDAGEKWNDAGDQWLADVESNKDGALEKVAVRLGKKSWLARLGYRFRHDSWALIAALAGLVTGTGLSVVLVPVVAPAVSVILPGMGEFLSSVDGMPLIFFSVFWGGMPGIFLTVPLQAAQQFRLNAIGASQVAFAKGYPQQVSQWAMLRYGVTMKNRWDSTAVHLADDVIYVGEKNGEKVYCFETPDGWVLGSRDGTELPVLTGNLIEA